MTTLRYLYLVARWGNEIEGPNGKDTLYLVAAQSHVHASNLVDIELHKMCHQNVSSRSNWICLLGKIDEESMFDGILKGPYYDMSAISGARMVWTREYNCKRWQAIAKITLDTGEY